jgi:hypothetical protein
MSKGPMAFRQRDLTRALRASIAAGMTPTSVTIDRNGNISLGFSEAPKAPQENWDNVINLWDTERTGRPRKRPTGT